MLCQGLDPCEPVIFPLQKLTKPSPLFPSSPHHDTGTWTGSRTQWRRPSRPPPSYGPVKGATRSSIPNITTRGPAATIHTRLRARLPRDGCHQDRIMGRVDASCFIGGAVRQKTRTRQDARRGHMRVTTELSLIETQGVSISFGMSCFARWNCGGLRCHGGGGRKW